MGTPPTLGVELPAHRAPVQLEAAGERANAPSVLVQDMHPSRVPEPGILENI